MAVSVNVFVNRSHRVCIAASGTVWGSETRCNVLTWAPRVLVGRG